LPITLSSHEIGLLTRAMKVLASPLDAQCPNSWRAAANRCLRELTGADSAGFLLPVPDGPYILSEEHDRLAFQPGLPLMPMAAGASATGG
jgi:hypothetical protein